MSKRHKVTPFGRWLFWVSSASRADLEHLVDLEPELDNEGNPEKGGQLFRCSCEAHEYNVERPCRHVRAVISFLKPVFAFFGSFDMIPKRRYTLNPNKKHGNPS